MKKETVALVALIVIVLASLSAFVIATNTSVLSDLFTTRPTVALGDCVNVTYIGRYSSNQTIFDSSYGDVKNKTRDTPLNVFVTFNKTATAWKNGYSQDVIKGFMNGLIGMKEGDTKTVGPIPPADGYGNKLAVGNSFHTNALTASNYNRTVNMNVTVTNISHGNITLYWTNPQFPANFTMPEGVMMKNLTYGLTYYSSAYDMLPYFLWENCTKVVNTTHDTVTFLTTPNRATNISPNISVYYSKSTIFFVFPNATKATWNDSVINITSTPKKDTHYVISMGGDIYNVTVGNVTDTHVNVTVEGQTYALNRTVLVNRTFVMDRYFSIPLEVMGYPIAQYILDADVQKAGYSLNPLAGENLTFELTVDKIYKQNP